MTQTIHKFGSWPSNVSAEFVAGKNVRFQTLHVFQNRLYWTEMRPQENGRGALVCAAPDLPAFELLPAPFSVRSKVHEYGGNGFLVSADYIYFVNADDQQIWFVENQPLDKQSSIPRQLTNRPNWRFADLVLDKTRQRLICVAEIHDKTNSHPENMLATIALQGPDTGTVTPLVEGDDFYASPCLSNNDAQLAFVSWNLPDMPWEGAKLHISHFDESGNALVLERPEDFPAGAFFQPQWDKDDSLWFVNDETGFGQLYRHDGHETKTYPLDGAECALPLWNFGMKTYGFLDDGRVACAPFVQGETELVVIDPAMDAVPVVVFGQDKSDSQALSRQRPKISAIDQLVTLENQIAAIVSRPDHPDAIVLFDLQNEAFSIQKTSGSLDRSIRQISIAQKLVFENESGQSVYGYYYPPCSNEIEGPQGEKPPVILTAHGGPTAFSHGGFKPKIQYWTSRGFGYFDINYSGSWGFGKAYRQRLDGQWGVRDVTDMEAGARYLARAGLADPSKLLISGSSAGGYTVLMALVNSDLFAAGASYYGISDMARLHAGTHKFEAGYTIGLLGLTPDNEKDVLAARSPLLHADQISSPVIFFQGLLDKVVPPDQAELMVDALKNNGIETRYQTFANEGHGFRDQQNIKTALTMEYQFYKDVLAL